MRFPSRWTDLRHAGSRLLLLGLLVAGLAGRAAEVVPLFSQRTWLRTDGLPANEITGLCLDRSGYLWIATWTGLARFDGTRFQSYDYQPPGQASAEGFAAIVSDPVDEGVWAAPYSGGLVRCRYGRFEEEVLPGNYSRQRIARLFMAADGALWIGFEGGEVMRLHGGRHQVFGARDGLGPVRSTQFASDGNGRVWLANGPQLAWYESGVLYPMALEGITENVRIASARQDGPWVLTRGWLHKVVDGRLGLKLEVNSSFNARSVQALMEDSTGAIWIGTRARGVLRHTLPDQRSDSVFETPEDVGVLLEDGAGNIWAGSHGGGLVRSRSGAAHRFDKAQGLQESHTLGVAQDHAGTLWIANRDGGVAFITEAARVRTLTPPRMRDTFSARSVAPFGPEGILVTTSQGLLRATQDGLVPVDAPGSPPQPPAHGEMRVTFMASNGDYWIGLDPGRLGRLRAGVWHVFTTADGLDPSSQQVITEDGQGRVWVGTEEGGLFRQEGERFTPVPLAMPVGAILAVHFDGSGVGWVGTSNAGLLRLGAPAGRNLDKRHGLPSGNITQVIGDDRGNLWFGSPDGIFRVRREELEQFFSGRISHVDAANLSEDEGLGEVNCATGHQPAAWKSRDGLLWFATRQGLVAVDPRRDKPSETPLVVQIDAVRAGDLMSPGNATVRLPPQPRLIDLDYSVLCLSTPERVRVRVRLEGYEDDWTTPDAPGLARYPRLPPGEYRFMVEAHLAGAPGTSAQAGVAIVVAAAWWQTLWFRVGVAAAVLVLAGVVVRARSHRRLRARVEQLEAASAIAQERARIAQNIHDDLGSGLTRISLLTQAGETGDGRPQLDKIYRTVGDLIQSMDEIVWAVNPKNDNLENFANYLVEYAQGFLSDADIRCRVLLPDVLPPFLLPAQFRHHLFLSCKEALNNVVKHARATEATIQLRVESDRLVVVLADNGRGLEDAGAAGVNGASRHGAKNGLGNMRVRLESLGGSCDIDSTASGTTVTFVAPLNAHSLSP